jgi:2-polyprenyl-3-methyl-5-hydroxy-6-metoxy-1,4-benzoquinol methylase
MGDLVEKTLPGLHGSLIAHVAGLRRDAQVLDIGCGSGAWLERLADAGFSSLHGIDLDIEQFRCARATCSRADLDRDDLALGGRQFDLITAIELVEHLENPGRLYKHIREHLAPGGVALVTTPNIHSLVSRLRHLVTGRLGQFDDKSDPTHVTPLLLVGLERILPRHGLRIVERWGHPERGSLAYRKPLVLAAQLLGAVLPDDVPGDLLCVLIQRAA